MKKSSHSYRAFINFLLLLSSISMLSGQDYHTPVELLHDRIAKRRFLESVFKLDRDTRRFEDSVMIADGWHSESHVMAIDSLRLVDSILTTHIDRYLDHYGFPEGDYLAEHLQVLPWKILLHSKNHEVRKKHFPTLYKAYDDGLLEQRRLVNFLEDEYKRRFQRTFQSYSVDQARIKELLKELEWSAPHRFGVINWK